MAAQVAGGTGGVEFPFMRVLADQVFHPTSLSTPGRILPGTTHRRNIRQPWHLARDSFQFLAIAEFPRPAGTLDRVEPQLAGKFVFLPIGVERADVGDVR